jgi:hypothetical protein
VTDDVLPPAPNGANVLELLSALNAYRVARQALLETLGLGQSNRDPLAEFAEHLVAALWGGQLAESRVQANYDLTSADGQYRWSVVIGSGSVPLPMGAGRGSGRSRRREW